MQDLPEGLEPLWDAAQMRAADAWTIDSLGVQGGILMDHAGRAVAGVAQQLADGGPVVALCGPGNNGGDGWVAARHLLGRGVPTVVLSTRNPDELKGDAAAAAKMFVAAADALGWKAPDGGPAWRQVSIAEELQAAVSAISPSLVVDALFGTGLTRPLEGLAGDVVKGLDELDLPVLAVDLPSGLPTDGAAPKGPCAHASHTVTFGGRKIAHASEPGRFRCGDVIAVDIGILRDGNLAQGAWCFAAPALEQVVTPAARTVHKGSFGHVAILEGSPETAGAARLAARAALRAGAGLVTLLVDDPARDAGLGLTEVMRRRFDADDPSEALEGIDAIVVGPGLGRSEDALARGRAALLAAAGEDVAAVVDADALTLLTEPALVGLRCVATPHPGEAGTLLASSSGEVQSDRIGACERLLEKHATAVWVLKGACPLTALPDGRVVVHEGGTPALAVAGSGDVLTGAIAAFLARGWAPAPAAVAGVAAHQATGVGLPRGTLAGELADGLREALAEHEAE
jgi:NAD(P)H-hydrate epimerase